VARVCPENPDAPQVMAGGEAPLPSLGIPGEEEDADAFFQDGKAMSRDTEAIGQESEAPVRYAAGRKPSPGRQLRSPEEAKRRVYTPQQRLMLLDTWRRSGLPALDFASLVGISKHTLYAWKQLFERQGPAGLLDQPRGAREGSRLPELTKRTILMLKEQHPEWGCQRISDLLVRGPALPASASAVARVLHEAGYESTQETTHPHPDHVRRFERAQPNQLWQTDLFTFVLKRQNRRVYLVAFLDDHSRFLVSYGLHASQAAALVLEVLEAGLANYGPPEEILTDNGAQYVTWRGKSQFTRRLEQRGIRQLVSRPQRPQTLGKIERFWGTLWREFLETAVFADLAEARTRIGHFIDYYNFQRPHRGADGLVPADRFFQAAPTVLQTLKERVAANALELARFGQPKSPFYVTGQVAGQTFSVHAEGERLVLRRQDQEREEIELTSAGHAPLGTSVGPGGGVSPAVSAAEPLPAPLCPDGSPRPGVGEPACAAPLAPGQSGLDLVRLAEATDVSPVEPANALPPDDQTPPGGAP
jgi:transposase InsO family protein